MNINLITSSKRTRPAGIPRGSTGGDCYEVSGKHVLDQSMMGNKELTLVHGIVTGQGPISGIQYGHAWVEDGDTVIDLSNGRNLQSPKALYYALGNISETRRYSVEETRKKILEHKHWGPWDIRSRY
jgi:hypothetical protein